MQIAMALGKPVMRRLPEPLLVACVIGTIFSDAGLFDLLTRKGLGIQCKHVHAVTLDPFKFQIIDDYLKNSSFKDIEVRQNMAYMLLFLLKNVNSFCICKATHIFFQQKYLWIRYCTY